VLERMTPVRRRRHDGPQILFSPDALLRLTAGFDHLAAVMAVTLGPTQGPILNALSRGSVELVSDAGTVARRIVEVPDRGRNAGAMILRHLSWQTHERFGDGAATAAVLSRAMVSEGVARIAAGVDPASIGRGLERALPAALAALSRSTYKSSVTASYSARRRLRSLPRLCGRVGQDLQINALQRAVGALVQSKLPVRVQQLVEWPPDRHPRGH
jgi:chaperonin GroEL (HSP60 family)